MQPIACLLANADRLPIMLDCSTQHLCLPQNTPSTNLKTHQQSSLIAQQQPDSTKPSLSKSTQQQHPPEVSSSVGLCLTATPSSGLRMPGYSRPKVSRLTVCEKSKAWPWKGLRSCMCMLPCWKLRPGAMWKLPATCGTAVQVEQYRWSSTSGAVQMLVPGQAGARGAVSQQRDCGGIHTAPGGVAKAVLHDCAPH
jgi:hypothetical protein